MSLIKRTKLYEEVVNRMLEMIKTNNMKAGEKLQSEKELASIFGVSRMAIREALSALQSAGVIEVRHGSGIYLRDINDQLTNPISIKLLAGKENLLNILELRKGLESEAAYLTAIRANQVHVKRLEEILQQMDSEISTGGTAAEEDFKFHRALVRATGNPVFAKVFDTIGNVFYEGLKSSHEFFSKNLGPRLVVLEEHRLILDYIKQKKPAEAREAMRVHLENVEVKLRGLPSGKKRQV